MTMPPETPQADTADLLGRIRIDEHECSRMTISSDHAETLELMREAKAEIERLSSELRREVSDRQSIELLYEHGKAELQAAKEATFEEAAVLIDGFARQAESEGWTGRDIAVRTLRAAAAALRDRLGARAVLSASPSPIPARAEAAGAQDQGGENVG